MNRRLLLVLSALLASLLAVPGSWAGGLADRADLESLGARELAVHVPGEVILRFDPDVSPADVQSIRSDLGGTVLHRFRTVPAELWKIDGLDVPDAISRYHHDPRVAAIEPNRIVRIADVPETGASVGHSGAALARLYPNDPLFGDQWGLHNTGQSGGTFDADIDAPEAWDVVTGGAAVLGVVDTGVDFGHPDLAANIYTNPGEIAGNGVDDDGNGYVDDVSGWDFANDDNDPQDDNGHGTHCAGVAAAVGDNGVGMAGVCWSARILPLKFLTSTGSGTLAGAIEAIEYAGMMGADVILAAWNFTGYDGALESAIGATGSLLVAQAGNSGANIDVSPTYPACFPLDNVIVPVSTTRFDFPDPISNYGVVNVDLGVPGRDILGTILGGGYATWSSSGRAASCLAGAACLVKAAGPWQSAQDVRVGLLNWVEPLPPLFGIVATGGRLDLASSLNVLTDVSPEAGPAGLGLRAGRPNPFGSTTTISFELPSPSEVRLEIFDVRGRRVRVLASGRQKEGHRAVLWDGRNDAGEPVAGGVYFARLSAGGLEWSRRIVRLR